jgi:tetratricopeptide (TPR) repeat protein
VRRFSAAAATPARRKELSVCMIVRNEEALLERAVASVRDIADEIVVVDTGSTDRTVDVAQGLGARVSHFAWNDDWSAARNASLRQATKDWILVFDADQTLDPGSRDEVVRLIQTDDLVGYLLLQRSYTDEGRVSCLEHRSLRLFPNHPDILYTGRIHEQVIGRGTAQSFRQQNADVLVHHDGYRPGTADPQAKAQRDLPVLEQLIRDEPESPFHHYNLGVTNHLLGREDEAERHLRRAVGLMEGASERPPYLVNAHVTLALALAAQGKLDPAAKACQQALRVSPHSADALCTLGSVEMRRGNLGESFSAYRQAFDSRDPELADSVTDRSASGWKPLLGMGEVRLLEGRFEEAAALLEQARAIHPTHEPILTGLAQAFERSGRLAEAEAVLSQALARCPVSELVRRLLAQVLQRRGRAAEARALLRPLGDREEAE